MAAKALLLTGALGLATRAEAQIRFTDIAARAGVDHVVRNSETPNRYQIEPMIAGVALFDYDNDGRLDIYLCNGASIPGLEKSDLSFSNRLYRNRPGLVFEDVTDRAGVSGAGYSMGVAAGDYDRDGWTDLYVTGVNRNILYRNKGDGSFEDVTASAGVAGEVAGRGKVWSVGAGFFDYDNDGDLDLLVVNYCVWSPAMEKRCGAPADGYRTYCHPDTYDPLPNILYRNNGNGTFSDVSAESGIGAHPGKGMGLAFADFDADGWIDVFIANDAWRNFLFRNRGDGRFEEIGFRAGVAYVDAGRPVSGMGVDFQDYDGDGRPDIFMTALSNETFPLFRNEGNGMFRDETFGSRLGGQSLAFGGWSTGMVDLDNDGHLDLFVAGGHVQTNEELYTGRSSRQPNRVFRNLGDGAFQDVSRECGADFQQVGLHRGAAFGDFDDDGRIDAVVTRLNEPVEVFHNQTEPSGHFLLLKLRGAASNPDGLGTSVRLVLGSGRSLVRHATTAGGYGGSRDKRIHFGLGREDAITRLEIMWPGGQRQVLENVGIDRILEVREPAARVAGTGVAGFSGDGGPATAAQINAARALAIDAADNIYVSDGGNNRIRRLNVAVSLVVSPSTLAITRSTAPWVTAYIQLPAGRDASDINLDTVVLQAINPATGAVRLSSHDGPLVLPRADGTPVALLDTDLDGTSDQLVLKFDRGSLATWAAGASSLVLRVEGQFQPPFGSPVGTYFSGDTSIH